MRQMGHGVRRVNMILHKDGETKMKYRARKLKPNAQYSVHNSNSQHTYVEEREQKHY